MQTNIHSNPGIAAIEYPTAAVAKAADRSTSSTMMSSGRTTGTPEGAGSKCAPGLGERLRLSGGNALSAQRVGCQQAFAALSERALPSGQPSRLLSVGDEGLGVFPEPPLPRPPEPSLARSTNPPAPLHRVVLKVINVQA
jgi:hypothetical protein